MIKWPILKLLSICLLFILDNSFCKFIEAHCGGIMAFYGYEGDSENCYWTPSQFYDSGESQLFRYDSSSASYTDESFVNLSELNYSVYSFSEPRMLQYEPPEFHSCYNNYYENSVIPSEVNYDEPKLLRYEPTPYYEGYYHYPETKFTISYSQSAGFYDEDFEEYDPTPYGGGYDQTIAYGKPLTPSDDICYPKTTPQPDNTPPESFSYSSIPSPYGKDDDLPKKPPNESKPVDTKTETKTETHVKNGDNISSDDSDDEVPEPPDVIPRHDENQQGDEDGTSIGDYGYETERQAGRLPYGSGLETLDICESIFGYWPCLAKIEQQRRNECCQHETRMDPWKGAADYLFGSPGVYDYDNYHHQQQQQAQYYFYQNSRLQ